MQINLISDTITRPTQDMRQAMAMAEVGDDVFGQDPTVNKLEERVASMFGKEAAVFCPSGTMTNQIGIKVNTNPLDEIICDISSHVYQYETAGYAYNSGVAVSLLHGEFGKISPQMIEAVVKPDFDWLPVSKLVVIENSTNRGGGNYYTLKEMQDIHNTCQKLGLRLHLDGARLFNVLVETNDSPKDIGPLFDTISICLSKGLGAPVGSVLIGNKNDIRKARRLRKVMGGGMRQSGILAAACLYALDHHVKRLKIDNERARKIGNHLSGLSYVIEVLPVKTNILIFELRDMNAADFVQKLLQHDILAHPFGPKRVRFVTHMELNDQMIDRLLEVLSTLETEM